MSNKKIIPFFGANVSKLLGDLKDRSASFEERFQRLSALRIFRRLKLEQIESLINKVTKSKSAFDRELARLNEQWKDSDYLGVDDQETYRKVSKKIARTANRILAGYDELSAAMDELLKPSKQKRR